jgi:hypothetical protein
VPRESSFPFDDAIAQLERQQKAQEAQKAEARPRSGIGGARKILDIREYIEEPAPSPPPLEAEVPPAPKPVAAKPPPKKAPEKAPETLPARQVRFIQVEYALAEAQKGMSATAFGLYFALYARSWAHHKETTDPVTIPELEETLGATRNTIRNARDELISGGWIEVAETPKQGERAGVRFRVFKPSERKKA